ncbi:MAG: response regulator [Blastocatellia bacterium]|nr:response regulator [Blastocatellia bacterium]
MKGNIFIVDDSINNLTLLEIILKTRGYTVKKAKSGREALDAIRQEPPDLVMLDIMMPEMDGYDVCRTLKSEELLKDIPIIFISALDDPFDKVKAFEVGGVDYVSKPFHAKEVIARVEVQLKIRLLQKDLEKQRLEAIEANRAKSLFLSNMSHELRTPLNAILGFAQLMQRDPDLNEDNREKVSIILRSGEHLLTLIDDVLSLSKIEAGRMSLNEKDFDLHVLLHALQEMLGVKVKAKGLKLVFSLSNLPHFVYGDDVKLRQILLNLLGNAVKFTQTGTVTLRAGWDGKRATFEIEDTGYGISQEDLVKIFEPFVQTESGRISQEGTGLGLALSRKFADLMKGEITVKSQLGYGTTFKLEVPLVEIKSEQKQVRRKVVGLENGQQYKILIADDTIEHRYLLAKLLSSVGFEIREAEDGQEAINIWKAWSPDLIWMDVRMPKMDGLEVTRYIRQHENPEKKVVIVTLTSAAFDHERETIFAAGVNDLVTKPFKEERIFEKIEQYLGVRYLYQDDNTFSKVIDEQFSSIIVPKLANLPKPLLDELKDAAILGDLDTTNEVLGKIEVEDRFLADRLNEMVKGFRFDAILDMINSL